MAADALIVFLFHVQRNYVPAGEMEQVERLVTHGPMAEELAELDPYTMASVRGLLARLCEPEAEHADNLEGE